MLVPLGIDLFSKMALRRLTRRRFRFTVGYVIFFVSAYSFLDWKEDVWSAVVTTYHKYLPNATLSTSSPQPRLPPPPPEEKWQYCLPGPPENQSAIQQKNNSLNQSAQNNCGKPFNKNWLPYLERFNLSEIQISEMTPDDDEQILRKDPTFVTALSDNHFSVTYDIMLKSLAQHFPKIKMLVYDLGLSAENVEKLRKLPQVLNVRKFNFSAYPGYVKNLYEYRWKPLLIAECLEQFGSIFYADSHVIWEKDSLSPLLEKMRCIIDAGNASTKDCRFANSTFLLCHTEHSIYAITDKRLYDYFPINLTNAKRVEMGCTMLQLAFATSYAKREIHKWAVLCALEKDCMAPEGAQIQCKFTGDRFSDQANCHGYDQSVLNILLAIKDNYDSSRYIISFNHKRS